jgi:phosphoglucosamine mutase
VTLFPQKLINVKLKVGQNWASSQAFAAEQAAVRAVLGNEGRLLIRPSGTEPLLRVMVEARKVDMATQAAERLAQAARDC